MQLNHSPIYSMPDDIYYSRKRLETAKKRLRPMKNAKEAVEVVQHLDASGISAIRVLRYATCLPKILNALYIKKARKKDIEVFVVELNKSSYKAWTKHAFKLTVKKLFQYLTYGDTSWETNYPDEVSWLKLHISEAELEKDSRVGPDKLLSGDDIAAIVKSSAR